MSSTLQMVSLPFEPQWKPQNTGLGSLSLLQLRSQTGFSWIAYAFFTKWAMREDHIEIWFRIIFVEKCLEDNLTWERHSNHIKNDHSHQSRLRGLDEHNMSIVTKILFKWQGERGAKARLVQQNLDMIRKFLFKIYISFVSQEYKQQYVMELTTSINF